MNAEFNWWLLIVGIVVGAALVWLVLADTRRREADVTARERASEARWIAETMRAAGRALDDRDAADVLRLHEAYLAAPPPDLAEGGPETERVGEDVILDSAASDGQGDARVTTAAQRIRAVRDDDPAARRAMAHPLAAGERPEAPIRDR